LRPGLRVLHLAPERALFKYIAERVGDSYDPRDLKPEHYKELQHRAVTVKRIDLCTDADALPTDHYDLILHNHVMEHVACNMTAVLYHLHRSLNFEGLHMFSVPILGGRWEESFVKMDDQEEMAQWRTKRFGQWDHVRRFGEFDLDKTLGQIFDIEKQLNMPLIDLFGEETLRRYNIPEPTWQSFTGTNVFIFKKDDIKLRDTRSCGRRGPISDCQHSA
jgi:phosphoglycolate phosphatase